MEESIEGPTILGGMLHIIMDLANKGFFLSSSVGGLDTVNGLTTPSLIHLSKTWYNSSTIHGITGGSSNTFPSSLFLFSPTNAVMAWNGRDRDKFMVRGCEQEEIKIKEDEGKKEE